MPKIRLHKFKQVQAGIFGFYYLQWCITASLQTILERTTADNSLLNVREPLTSTLDNERWSCCGPWRLAFGLILGWWILLTEPDETELSNGDPLLTCDWGPPRKPPRSSNDPTWSVASTLSEPAKVSSAHSGTWKSRPWKLNDDYIERKYITVYMGNRCVTG